MVPNNQSSGCFGVVGGWVSEVVRKRLEGTFRDNGTIQHLDKGLGYKDACVC